MKEGAMDQNTAQDARALQLRTADWLSGQLVSAVLRSVGPTDVADEASRLPPLTCWNEIEEEQSAPLEMDELRARIIARAFGAVGGFQAPGDAASRNLAEAREFLRGFLRTHTYTREHARGDYTVAS
jgi:hypothetical protein